MPNRILHESINESRGLAEVSAFAQDLYKRLITYADDYGRFNADVDLMRARLYPRELDAITPDDVDSALVELGGIGKVRFYTAAASARAHMGMIVFGYFPNWAAHQRIRNTRARCPDPGAEEVNDWYLRRFIPIRLKEAIFARDACECQLCGRSYALPGVSIPRAVRLLSGALHLDHIVPVRQGGRATDENLRLLCATCNLSRPKALSLEDAAQLAAGGCASPPIAANGRDLPQAAARARAESNPNPNPNPIQSENEDEDAAPSAPAAAPPEAVQVFHERLMGATGYEPSPEFLQKVAAKYGGLDLEEEALKIRSWLQEPKNRKRLCSTGFVLKWLQKATDDPPVAPSRASPSSAGRRPSESRNPRDYFAAAARR